MPVPTGWPDLSPIPGNNSPQGSEIVGPFANDYFQAAYAFIRQLYDGGALPNKSQNANSQTIQNLAPGVNSTDAANLNQVNTILGAPAQTRVVFQQAAAPVGWTVDGSSNFTDCAMRFNQNITSGGSTNWSAWNFGGSFTSDGHALTVSEMPSHGHGDAGHGHGFNDPGHNHGFNDPGHAHSIPAGGWGQAGQDNGGGSFASNANQYGRYNGGNGGMQNVNGSGTGCWLNAASTGCGIATGYANIQANGGNAAHTHTYKTPQVKYADCIIGIKS